VARLQKYLRKAAGSDGSLRVTFEPELLDLCNILSVQRAAKRLRQKHEKIDSIILNAGIGGWTGIDFYKAFKQFFRDGIYFVTKPEFKTGSVGAVSPPQLPKEKQNKDIKEAANADVKQANGVADARVEPQLGEVFTANTFGHYLLVHYLMPLLLRPAGEEPGRVIWVGTLEAYDKTFSMDDFQGMKTSVSYESSKRLSDVLSLTASAPSSRPYTTTYFSTGSVRPSSRAITSAIEDESLTPRKASLRASTRARSSTPNGRASSRTSSPRRAPTSSSPAMIAPTMYTSHPGMVVTDIVQIYWLLVYAWVAVMYFARWYGSPWHNTQPYSGATAMTHLALAPKSQLDAFANGDGAAIKWGSATNWRGSERVKLTEVDQLYDDKGQSYGQEARERFFGQGREAWRRMEELRVEWEQRLKDSGYDEGLS
jgi:3-keto steroid reductase